MQWINDKSDLEVLLQEEQAIVLLYVGWSGYSLRVLKKLEGLLEVLPEVPIFVLSEERMSLFPLGYGTIFWLQSGRIVDLLLQPYQSTIEELREQTHLAFSLPRR